MVVSVNFRRWSSGTGVFLALWLVAVVTATAQTKVIRLRNEQIQTAAPDQTILRAAQGPSQPVSGLYLLQFTGTVEASWKAQLAAMRVDLLRYIPDDAFVARLQDVDLNELRNLPYVQWIGPYRPEHKLHGVLQSLSQVQAPLRTAEVSVLLSPRASAVDQAAARALFSKVQQQSSSRFGGVLRGQLAIAQLRSLAASPSVLWIEPSPKMKLNDEISSKIVAGEGTGHQTYMQDLGFDGSGVTVAVADSGLHLGDAEEMHADLAGRTPAFFYYGELSDASDEHAHGTHVTGIIAGSGILGTTDELGYLYGLGVAPGASIVTQRIFDGAGGYQPPPTFETMTRDAVQAGADIGSNSWGDDTQGRYDISAAEFDALVRDADWTTPGDQPYILEFSAGNAGPGPQTIGSPAVAKNVIATGAAQNDRFDFFIYEDGSETMADFSSRGPTEDGRIKPDVVAPGTWIASLRSPIADDNNAWLDIDFDYLYMGGTSQAGPQISGAAAVFVQYYRDSFGIGTPSPALVKAALIHSAVDMDDEAGTTPTPNMDEGWGRVDLTEIIFNPRTTEYLDQTDLLATGQAYERSVIVADSTEPLRVTLVYTDVPGFPAAIPALVNNLDLELIGPDGRIYRGNQFEQGESIPESSTSDSLNNVEGIYISTPAPGEYILRVRGVNVAQDARVETPEIDQDFALVVSGSIPSLETGIVLIDRTRYTAPGRINVKLFDLDFAGLPTAKVIVKSATEPDGLNLTLRAMSGNGVLTGSVATVSGPANAADTKLQITHGDWIKVEYRDELGELISVANAVADLVPPVISSVGVTEDFGQMTVNWVTDEPATGIVRYGTNATLSLAVTNSFLTETHSVALDDLVSGRTYYYAVIATDAAGNVRTNDNGGALFSFVPAPSATVLLVDAYVPNFEDDVIPLSSYTGPLDQIGVTYDVWNTTTLGMPGFNNLRSYQIVMWRLNDSFNSTDLIPAAQQTAIQQYLNNGGAFFMASMEILSRLLNAGSGAFVTNVLHVGRFLRNTDPFSHCLDCDEDFRVPLAAGVAADVIGDGMQLTLDYANYPSIDFLDLGPDFSDTFGPTTNATPFLVEQDSGKACGVRYPKTGSDSTGRVVFVSFPLDTIPSSGPESNNRASFLRRVFQFLAPGLNGNGTVAMSQESYRLPDLVTVEVGDADLAGQPGTMVQVYSTSFTNRVSVNLTPTARPDLFRGTFTLTAGTNPPSAGRLPANEGDTVFVEYFDTSGQITVTATASVDATAPEISEVQVAAEYQDALVSWDTSEPADSLVQYGESVFLGKTAYVSDLEFSRSIQLIGLTPDRLYYYKVVSRDSAGNTVENPGGDGLRTFRTLTPLTPPFVDTMQGGGTNWTVFNGDDTQYEWTIGSPQNGLVANTPSGDAKAWASNIQGDPADTIDTFLISPAIDLTGGNVARLRFNHAYDFSEWTPFDLLEGGELLIVTNSVSAPVTLATYFDSNGGWEEEEIDLTPYIGSVIFLVWHHQLLSFESAFRRGWAVDDVEITVTNIPPVRIAVTNNLAQARVSIAGPATRVAQGYSTNFIDLPPGRYVATWQAVTYYQTPSAQTNTLESNQNLKLTGTYTFPDENQNGMSDLWEQQFFGEVSEARNCLTDSDGDGFPDCAEFAAGTSPVSANSFLKLNTPVLQVSVNKVRFQWASSPGRQYQVQCSKDGATWEAASSWVQATSGTTSVLLGVPAAAEPFLFRLAVRP